MNLAQTIQYITNVAKEHPLVKTVIEGDVYQLNSLEVKYGVFCITQPMNNVIKEDNIMKYIFTIFYVDRLTEDESNKLVIQTDGINTIHEVFNYIKTNAQNVDVNIPITFTTFTEKFADKCGGAYANVTVEIDDETGDCDFYYEDILIEPIPGTSHTTVLDNYYTKVEVEDLIRNATHDADMVDYDNSQTGLPATTAQEAIDQLYEIATTQVSPTSHSGLTERDAINSHPATAISVTPPSGYTSTDVDGLTKEIINKLNNNYTYKILNTVVSTWSDSTTYVKYPYEAVIPIVNIKESDSVEVIYNIIDAESTNYASGGELYDGFIKIFSKVNTEITIPTLVITKIEL